MPASAQRLRGLSAAKTRRQDRGVTARPTAPLSLRAANTRSGQFSEKFDLERQAGFACRGVDRN